MGVRFLNKLIQTKCPNAISRIHFEELRGKKIAVDISIYIYRFIAEGGLLENMYLMASIFLNYNIHAIFVFDGPPPAQKTEIIEMRKKKKENARRHFHELEAILRTKKKEIHTDTHELSEIEDTMSQLKKQFIHIRDVDITNIKDLLVSFGFTIVDAEGEADALCAKLAIKKQVFACLSDDTDMFVYGCPYVLRHISLLNHSAVCYNMSEILKGLDITQHEFKMLCIVSGTDYSSGGAPQPQPQPQPPTPNELTDTNIYQRRHDSNQKHRIFQVYELLRIYKFIPEKERIKFDGFYDWLETKKKFVNSVVALVSNEDMFDVTKVGSSTQYKQLVVLNRTDIERRRIVELMMKEDFIFIESRPQDREILNRLSCGSGAVTSSQLYGVGAWENSAGYNSHSASAASAASVSSTSTASTSYNRHRRRSSSLYDTSDYGDDCDDEISVASKAYVAAVGVISDAHTDKESQQYKASLLASDVYGIQANSFTDLENKIFGSSKRNKKHK